MRNRIKKVAVELLIRHGYRGLRFGDIATRQGTTRANIHYHFGTKQKLVEEVVEDYMRESMDRVRAIWSDDRASLQDKILNTMEFNRERYRKFNHRGTGVKPWSLITRMRLERDLLTARTKGHMRDFVADLGALVTAAIELAKERRELGVDAPVDDIALQLVFIINSAGSITQDTGSFDELERLYLAFARVIRHAYGRRTAPAAVRKRSRLASAG
jgi:TetR/AcrR family transcriptional regulator, transcriptional repressor for nem operon